LFRLFNITPALLPVFFLQTKKTFHNVKPAKTIPATREKDYWIWGSAKVGISATLAGEGVQYHTVTLPPHPRGEAGRIVAHPPSSFG
jgi:hypothetical protein